MESKLLKKFKYSIYITIMIFFSFLTSCSKVNFNKGMLFKDNNNKTYNIDVNNYIDNNPSDTTSKLLKGLLNNDTNQTSDNSKKTIRLNIEDHKNFFNTHNINKSFLDITIRTKNDKNDTNINTNTDEKESEHLDNSNIKELYDSVLKNENNHCMLPQKFISNPRVLICTQVPYEFENDQEKIKIMSQEHDMLVHHFRNNCGYEVFELAKPTKAPTRKERSTLNGFLKSNSCDGYIIILNGQPSQKQDNVIILNNGLIYKNEELLDLCAAKNIDNPIIIINCFKDASSENSNIDYKYSNSLPINNSEYYKQYSNLKQSLYSLNNMELNLSSYAKYCIISSTNTFNSSFINVIIDLWKKNTTFCLDSFSKKLLNSGNKAKIKTALHSNIYINQSHKKMNLSIPNHETFCISNPVVILLGIAEYDTKDSIPGAKNDIKKLINLYKNIYKYQTYIVSKSFHVTKDYIDKIKVKINSDISSKNKINNFDSVIFHYTGHGLEKVLVTSEGKTVHFNNLIFDMIPIELQENLIISFKHACRGASNDILTKRKLINKIPNNINYNQSAKIDYDVLSKYFPKNCNNNKSGKGLIQCFDSSPDFIAYDGYSKNDKYYLGSSFVESYCKSILTSIPLNDLFLIAANRSLWLRGENEKNASWATMETNYSKNVIFKRNKNKLTNLIYMDNYNVNLIPTFNYNNNNNNLEESKQQDSMKKDIENYIESLKNRHKKLSNAISWFQIERCKKNLQKRHKRLSRVIKVLSSVNNTQKN